MEYVMALEEVKSLIKEYQKGFKEEDRMFVFHLDNIIERLSDLQENALERIEEVLIHE